MSARDRIALMVVAAALVVGGFWMLVLHPRQNEASKLGSQISEAKAQLAQARTQLSQATALHDAYAADTATVARMGKAVPDDDSVPSLVYQLAATARHTDVDFQAVKLASSSGSSSAASAASATAASSQSGQSGSPSGSSGSSSGSSGQSSSPSGQPSSGAPPSGSTSGQSSSGSTSGGTPPASGTTPAQPVAATQTASAAAPPGSSVGPAGILTMPFSFTFNGSFFHLSDFFAALDHYVGVHGKRLQVLGRLLTVDGLALNAAPGGFPRMQASVAATAYMLPAGSGSPAPAAPGTAPAQPGSPSGTASAPTQPVSGSSTPPPTAPATVSP